MFKWKQPLSEEIFKKKYMINEGDKDVETIIQNISKEIASVEKTKEKQQLWQELFYTEIINQRFIPAGRILAHARPNSKQKTYINCYTVGIKDSLNGIYDTIKEMALIAQSSGGSGLNISNIRPEGAILSRGGTASGPLSFMKVINESANTICVGGARRSATIIILNVDHPDIEKFITCKHGDENKAYQFMNISVGINDEFMNAVEKDLDWNLKFDGKIYKTVKAKDLYNLIIENSFKYAEPGVLNLSAINKENNGYYMYNINECNPCGETSMPIYNVCDLGSIKLSTFVENPFTNEAKIDWERLIKAIHIGVRFLDNVLDATQLPLDKVKHNVKKERRIGLGFTAYADMLIKMKIQYGSEEAIQLTKKLAKIFRDESYKASIELAKEKGSFPHLDKEKYLQSNFIKRLPEEIKENIKKYGIRNINLNCIAPTGTISLSYGNNCSSGIEPVFALSYDRKVRQKDETFITQTVYDEAFLDWQNQFRDEEEVPKYFTTVANLTAEQHIAIQSLWQKYIDSSISKTVNLPSGTTIEKYKDLFMLAYKSGCKGITFFNPDGALAPVLSVKKESIKQQEDIKENQAPKRPQDLPCDIYQIVVDHKPVLVLLGKLNNKIYEMFLDYNFDENGDKKIDVMKAKQGIIRKIKSSQYDLIIKTDEGKELTIIKNIADTFDEMAGMISRFVSMSLRYGVPYQFIINQMQKTKSFNSFTKIVSRVLKKYIKDGEKVKTSDNKCPECNTELVFQSGCIICPSCGFSKCN